MKACVYDHWSLSYCVRVLKSHGTNVRSRWELRRGRGRSRTEQSGGRDESETRQRREPSRDGAEEEAERKRRQKQRRDAETTRRRKPAEFRAMNVKKNASRNSPESALLYRKWWWSQQPSARNNERGARLAPLTPLSGGADARGCTRRAHERHLERAAYYSAPRNKWRLHEYSVECRDINTTSIIHSNQIVYFK